MNFDLNYHEGHLWRQRQKEGISFLEEKKEKRGFWFGELCCDCMFKSTKAFSIHIVAVIHASNPITFHVLLEHLLSAKSWAHWYRRIRFQPDWWFKSCIFLRYNFFLILHNLCTQHGPWTHNPNTKSRRLLASLSEAFLSHAFFKMNLYIKKFQTHRKTEMTITIPYVSISQLQQLANVCHALVIYPFLL